MLASRQHVSFDVPAFPDREAQPGRRGGERDGKDRLARVRLTTSGKPLVAEGHHDSTGRLIRAITFTGNGTWFPAYDPCGLLVSATGPEKDGFRHRFSTKPQGKAGISVLLVAADDWSEVKVNARIEADKISKNARKSIQQANTSGGHDPLSDGFEQRIANAVGRPGERSHFPRGQHTAAGASSARSVEALISWVHDGES